MSNPYSVREGTRFSLKTVHVSFYPSRTSTSALCVLSPFPWNSCRFSACKPCSGLFYVNVFILSFRRVNQTLISAVRIQGEKGDCRWSWNEKARSPCCAQKKITTSEARTRISWESPIENWFALDSHCFSKQTLPRLGRKEGLAVREDWNWGFILELLWFGWQYALVLALSNGRLFRTLVFSTLSLRHKDIKVPGAMLRKSPCIKLVDFADGNVRLPNKFEF